MSAWPSTLSVDGETADGVVDLASSKSAEIATASAAASALPDPTVASELANGGDVDDNVVDTGIDVCCCC